MRPAVFLSQIYSLLPRLTLLRSNFFSNPHSFLQSFLFACILQINTSISHPTSNNSNLTLQTPIQTTLLTYYLISPPLGRKFNYSSFALAEINQFSSTKNSFSTLHFSHCIYFIIYLTLTVFQFMRRKTKSSLYQKKIESAKIEMGLTFSPFLYVKQEMNKTEF